MATARRGATVMPGERGDDNVSVCLVLFVCPQTHTYACFFRVLFSNPSPPALTLQTRNTYLDETKRGRPGGGSGRRG